MMIWAVGLRGAVAYGLALNLPQIEGESNEGIPAIESATLVIVVLSTLILGSATGPLLRRFDLQVMLRPQYVLMLIRITSPHHVPWGTPCLGILEQSTELSRVGHLCAIAATCVADCIAHSGALNF